MSNLCKQCQINLTQDNTYQSDWKSGARICKKCRKDNYKNINPKQKKIYCQTSRLNIKEEILFAYDNVCVCCDQNIWQFLSIDHIDGSGGEHRKSISRSGGTPFYYWLKSYNFPKDNYRLLCHNCNSSFGHYGFCPHKYILSSSSCLICDSDLLDNMFNIHIKSGTAICKFCIIDKSPHRKTAKDKNIKYRSLSQRRQDQKTHLFKIKMTIINGYGNKCVCCGESNPLFLTIDHINNDGFKDRKSEGYNQDKFYNSIIADNFPTQYQLLCYNCNLCRGFYGQCYHKLCQEIKKNSISIDEYKDIILHNK